MPDKEHPAAATPPPPRTWTTDEQTQFQKPLFEASHNLASVVDALRPQSTTLLHYCSLEAFYAIMDSARLRFTSAKSTNDPSEFFFGQKVVEDVLAGLPDQLGGARGGLIRGAETMLESMAFKAFVFCMSEALEDEAEVGELSQWRLYGADGRGVALVIDISDPSDAELIQQFGSIPRRVVYGEEQGRQLVRSEVERYLNAVYPFSRECAEFIETRPTVLHTFLLNTVFWLPSVIKHKAYRHEREVRLVRGDVGANAGNPLVFFERGGIRRPAIELSFSELVGPGHDQHHRSPIKGVIIGPSGDQSAIADSIQYFLDARGWRLDIRRSDIPYRAV